jgi:hypothetical protein
MTSLGLALLLGLITAVQALVTFTVLALPTLAAPHGLGAIGAASQREVEQRGNEGLQWHPDKIAPKQMKSRFVCFRL